MPTPSRPTGTSRPGGAGAAFPVSTRVITASIAHAAISRIVAGPGQGARSAAAARAAHHANAGARITRSWGSRCGEATRDSAAAPASEASSAPTLPRDRAPSTQHPPSAISDPAIPTAAGTAPLPSQEAAKPTMPSVLAPGVLPAANPSADTNPASPAGPTSVSDTATTTALPAAAPASARQSRRATSQTPSPIARWGLVAANASASQKPAAAGRSFRQAAYAAARPRAVIPSI